MATKTEKALERAQSAAKAANRRAREERENMGRMARTALAGGALGYFRRSELFTKVPGQDANAKLVTIAVGSMAAGMLAPKGEAKKAVSALTDASIAVAAYHAGQGQVAGRGGRPMLSGRDAMANIRALREEAEDLYHDVSGDEYDDDFVTVDGDEYDDDFVTVDGDYYDDY